MQEKRKKLIAPIVVTIIMILYYALYFGVLIWLLEGVFWKCALGIIPLIFSAVTVKVCIERINEIEKGEEDDLSKY